MSGIQNLKRTNLGKPFLTNYTSLLQVLSDRSLATLGDAYINFVYSLALSRKLGRPCGKKLKGAPLATAIKESNMRVFMPSRMDKHALSDAAEALLVYAWLDNIITMEESLETLEKHHKLEVGLCELLSKIKKRVKF